MNIQDWFPLGLTGLISLLQGTFKSSPASKFEINVGRNDYIMVCIASHLQASALDQIFLLVSYKALGNSLH